MSVTIKIESTSISNIQRAIKMLRLLPDITIRVSEKEDTYTPNMGTRRAIKGVKSRKNLVYCDGIEDFWKKIDE